MQTNNRFMPYSEYQDLLNKAEKEGIDPAVLTKELVEKRGIEIEGFENFSRQQIKQGVQEQDNMVSQSKQNNTNWLSNAVRGGVIAPTAMLGSAVIGSAVKKLGSFLYGITLPPPMEEAQKIQNYKAGISKNKPLTTKQIALEKPLMQKGGASLGSKLGLFGSRAMIGTQAAAMSNNIFKIKINPLFDKFDEIGEMVDVSGLIEEAKTMISNSVKYADSEKQEIIQDIIEISEDLDAKTSLRNLDKEKSALATKLPKKYFSMPKVPSSLQEARGALASVFRNKVHNTIMDTFDVNSARMYQEYASLQGLSKIGPKALSQGGRKGGFGSFRSWVLEELATPITTTTGKVTYKVGEALQYLPKKTLSGLTKLSKGLYAIDPVTAPDLLQYLPGTIGDAFEEYVELNPASNAIRGIEEYFNRDELIEEIQNTLEVDKKTAEKILIGDLIVF